MIEKQLKVLRAFQKKYPTSHVGGSIGLYLLGIDLKRNLIFSDLDVTTPNFTEIKKSDVKECSPVEDFNYRYKIKKENSNHYFKLEIRVDTNQSDFDVVNFDGYNYNVTKKETILYWKQKYAKKGINKHINDLITIATGVKPIDDVDDLPF